jgi:hypothetical protein
MEQIWHSSYMLLNANGVPFQDEMRFDHHSEAVKFGKSSNIPFVVVAFDTLGGGRRDLRISLMYGGLAANLRAVKVFDDMAIRQESQLSDWVTPRPLSEIYK